MIRKEVTVMNEMTNYIFRKLNYLERENRSLSASMFVITVAGATAVSWVIYFKNRKIENLKAKIKELEEE